jgi:multidrug efflux pump subunit AcrA (membrane-fusion protein)
VTANFKVTIVIATKDERLRPGMTARARIISAADTERLLVVPVHAVFEHEGRSYCYVQGTAGFEMREVTLGIPNDQMVQVRKGLTDGEQISLGRPSPERITRTRPL